MTRLKPGVSGLVEQNEEKAAKKRQSRAKLSQAMKEAWERRRAKGTAKVGPKKAVTGSTVMLTGHRVPTKNDPYAPAIAALEAELAGLEELIRTLRLRSEARK